MLKIRPIIKVREGVLGAGKKVRGSMEKAIDAMLDEAVELRDKIDPDFFMVTHSFAQESVDYVLPKLKEALPELKNVIVSEAGCVISTHCGAGTIGLLYVLKNE